MQLRKNRSKSLTNKYLTSEPSGFEGASYWNLSAKSTILIQIREEARSQWVCHCIFNEGEEKPRNEAKLLTGKYLTQFYGVTPYSSTEVCTLRNGNIVVNTLFFPACLLRPALCRFLLLQRLLDCVLPSAFQLENVRLRTGSGFRFYCFLRFHLFPFLSGHPFTSHAGRVRFHAADPEPY